MCFRLTSSLLSCNIFLFVTSLLLLCPHLSQGAPVSAAAGAAAGQPGQPGQPAGPAGGGGGRGQKVVRLYDEATPFREMSSGEFDVEKELNDPAKEWARVRTDPDFLLLNEDEQALQQFRSRKGQNRQQDILEDLMLSGRPLYMEEEAEDEPRFSRQKTESKRAGNLNSVWGKRAKQLRLSLTDNIDVLREKLFMEIARRNRLLNESQVSMANSGLANIG